MTTAADRLHPSRHWNPGAEQQPPATGLHAGRPHPAEALTRHTILLPRPTLAPDEARCRALWQTLADPLFVVRKDGTLTGFQAPPEWDYPVDADRLVGRRLLDLLPAALAQQALHYVEKCLRTGTPQSFASQLTIAGRERTFQLRLAPLGPAEVLAVARDVTDRAQMEKELLDLSHREQMRIGQDLHDSLGQHLTGLSFLSCALEKKLAAHGLPEAAEAAEINRLVLQALAQTRTLARGLFPVALESKGLTGALHELAATAGEMFGIECALDCDAQVAVADPTTATHLFRLAQEAVSNAVRHGKARHLVLSLKRAQDKAELAIRDDGVGLPKDPAQPAGLGLKIMRYRAAKIGGILDLQPAEGGGTLVTCRFPLEPRPSPWPDAAPDALRKDPA